MVHRGRGPLQVMQWMGMVLAGWQRVVVSLGMMAFLGTLLQFKHCFHKAAWQQLVFKTMALFSGFSFSAWDDLSTVPSLCHQFWVHRNCIYHILVHIYMPMVNLFYLHKGFFFWHPFVSQQCHLAWGCSCNSKYVAFRKGFIPHTGTQPCQLEQKMPV